MKRISLNLLFTLLTVIIPNSPVFGQTEKNPSQTQFFVGYELGEMAFNKFQFFAGEAGLLFKTQHMLRFVHMNVKIAEKHLSSDFANVVDGENVKGLFKGYELFYDIRIYKSFYAGASAGYYNNFYRHTKLNESVDHFSSTLGFELTYRETNIFKVEGLYFNLALPFRFYLNPLEKTELGNSTVNRHFLENNIWIFIGYQF